jgi:photosystem II stability/assembly factor-like uncharacterized protein
MKEALARSAAAVVVCALLCASAYGQEGAGSRYIEYLKWRMLSEQDEFGRIPLDARIIAAEQREALVIRRPASGLFGPEAAGVAPKRWTALGPGNIGGRIRSLVIHPTNPQKIWVGSVTGGIWVSSDGGASWAPVNDLLPSLVISSLAINPTNSNEMYAGTGEAVAANLDTEINRGIGIYKSVDGGTTWSRLSSTDPAIDPAWLAVNRVAVSPADGNIVLAATVRGIYRSTDAGATWTPVTSLNVRDVRFNPADGTKAVAGTDRASVFVSTNSGLSWSEFFVTTGGGGRVETAYAPSNPNVVYAAVDRNNGEVYRSTNGGVSWTLMSTPEHLGGQGFWNNAIWVAPNDPNLVVIGGQLLYRSTDGGLSFTAISNNQAPLSPHADQHAIVNDPGYNSTTNKRVYVTNDGGVYKAEDITVASSSSPPNGWTNLNNGLEITQFYGGAGKADGTLLGGTQDNATELYVSGTTWLNALGGDGGYVAADPADSYLYAETQNMWLFRSADGGKNWQPICQGLADASRNCGGNGAANFIAPFILDPNNSSRLLAGGQSLWRSNDVKTATPTWTAIKAPAGFNITAIAVAEGNPDIIWIGHLVGAVYKTTNGTAAAPSWTLVSQGLPARFASRILIDKSDHNTVYVTFGGYTSGNVWKTTDGGTTWTDIHGALPQAPIRSITRHPMMRSWLYVGSEVGVFTSEDGGATWTTTNDAPSNVSVDELFWPTSTTLVAATHGRGMFRTVVQASVRLDLNGDARSDIVWRNSATGENYVYFMNGPTISGEGFLRTVADQHWQIAGVGDFNGDGKSDILWRNSSTGENYIYLMNGTTIVGEGFIRTVADQNWQVAGIGDFDGDGKDDILWRNAATGQNYLYPMDALSIKASEGFLRTVADLSWQIVGVGDFDGDGKSDILWRNSSTGENYIYPMDGTAIKPSEGFIRTVANTAWQVNGVGDFNGDGKADIAWRNATTGEDYLYMMNGTSIAAEGFIRTVADLNWHIVAVGDYDGDGKSDLLWRNVSTGENYVYPMDGTTIKASEGFVRTVADQNWQVQR